MNLEEYRIFCEFCATFRRVGESGGRDTTFGPSQGETASGEDLGVVSNIQIRIDSFERISKEIFAQKKF